MKGVNIFESVEYISKFETDPENPTKWVLGCIDELTNAALDDMATTFEVDHSKPAEAKAKSTLQVNEKRINIVRLGLKGFKNFIHPQTGKEIEFKTISTSRFGANRNVVSDEVLKLIPGPVMKELADQIVGLNNLSEEEEKNS